MKINLATGLDIKVAKNLFAVALKGGYKLFN